MSIAFFQQELERTTIKPKGVKVCPALLRALAEKGWVTFKPSSLMWGLEIPCYNDSIWLIEDSSLDNDTFEFRFPPNCVSTVMK
jgi:hypothetical protein